MRTDLESGAWVEHTPIQDLKARHKDNVSRLVMLNLPTAPEGAEIPGLDAAGNQDMLQLQRDAVYAQIITAWSFDLPVPRIAEDRKTIEDRESLSELPVDDYTEMLALFTPFVVKVLRVPSPKGRPTATTSSSNGSSRARRAPSPTG